MGTGLILAWLLDAVVKLVATCSMPGDRVLLLTPVVSVERGGVGSRGLRGRYSGLQEAAWQVARLGRGVRTETVGPFDWSGSGSRLSGADVTGPGLRGGVRPGGYENIGLFELVIIAAEPRVLTAVQPTSWAPLLSSRGVLAAITHCDRGESRLFDPAGALVRAAGVDGLRYLDHIVLLCESGALVPGSLGPAAACTRVQVHADLHVFGRCSGRGERA